MRNIHLEKLEDMGIITADMITRAMIIVPAWKE